MEENNVEKNINKKINICCLISFIFSIIGIFIAGLPCGIVATILGIIGVSTFKADTQNHRWMGITGLALGAVEIVVMAIYIGMYSNM